jgi:prefoldin subunit 5
MNEHVYPVPAESHNLGDLLDPFLKEKVTQEGLTPDQQFTIVLFGEDASEHRDEVVDIIESTGPVARKSLDINQLSVISIDERRLNTFTTSLLYALLETDEDQPLPDTLRGDYIADEDERKIDYYLPRLIENIETALHDQGERFEEHLASMFPVDLDSQKAREMNQRLDKDVVTETTIIDFLLLAAASTEDENGVRSLLRFIREEKIDDGDMLSGGSSGVSGYSRIIEISYLLTKNQFNSEFRTARDFYEDGATSSLLNLLNETEEITVGPATESEEGQRDDRSETPLESFYGIEQRIEPLITSQFQGNATTIAKRLLREINGTRLIQNNSDLVREHYQSQKADLESEIDQLRAELTSLEGQGDKFDDTKIIVDSGEVDPYEEVINRVDNTNSVILRFIFGFDRSNRTSAFTTLEKRLAEHREDLASYRTQLDELLEDIRALETRCEQEVRQLERGYERLKAASVEMNPPDREQMITNLESAWEEELAQLKHDLPVVDFTDEDEPTEEILEKWEGEIDDSRKKLDEFTSPIDQLNETIDKLEQIDTKRDDVRETLSEIDDLMVVQ